MTMLPKSPAIIRSKTAGLELPARFVGRAKTCDIAFNLRMGAGSPGDMTRHNPPGTIEACLLDAASPVVSPGLAIVASLTAANTVRLIQAGDIALTAIYGIAQRVFPFQQPTTGNYSGAAPLGSVPIAAQQPIDVVRSGYVLVPIVGVPQKGGPVFVWAAASGGGHTQGGFEAAATGGSTIPLDAHSTFSGGVDGAGNGEVCFNI
jgi:hypothetical protein